MSAGSRPAFSAAASRVRASTSCSGPHVSERWIQPSASRRYASMRGLYAPSQISIGCAGGGPGGSLQPVVLALEVHRALAAPAGTQDGSPPRARHALARLSARPPWPRSLPRTSPPEAELEAPPLITRADAPACHQRGGAVAVRMRPGRNAAARCGRADPDQQQCRGRVLYGWSDSDQVDAAGLGRLDQLERLLERSRGRLTRAELDPRPRTTVYTGASALSQGRAPRSAAGSPVPRAVQRVEVDAGRAAREHSAHCRVRIQAQLVERARSSRRTQARARSREGSWRRTCRDSA